MSFPENSDSSLHSVSSLSTDASNVEQPVQLDHENQNENENEGSKLNSVGRGLIRRLSTGKSRLSLRSTGSSKKFTGIPYLQEAGHDEDHDYFGASHIVDAVNPNETEDFEFGTESISTTVDEQYPQAYYGKSTGKLDIPNDMPYLHRRRSTLASTIQSATKKFGYWDQEFHSERIYILITYLQNYAILMVAFAVALLIYWGSFFGRNDRFKNVKYAVIIADKQTPQVPPLLGLTIQFFFTKLPALQNLGDFHIIDYDNISMMANANNLSITDEVNRLVHHQNYWACFYVKENSTLKYYEAMTNASFDFNPAESLIDIVYETGSNFNGINNYISNIIGQIIMAYNSYFPQSNFTHNLIDLLDDDQKRNLILNSPNLIYQIPTMKRVDLIPVNDQIFTGAFSLGIVYLVIFSFFQFLFLKEAQTYISQKVKGLKYIFVRMLVTQISYVALGLSFVTLNRAFQIPFDNTFGGSGFLVIWMFSYLTISSLGSFIENFVLICVALKPQLIGFVLLFTAAINLGPVISPIVLCPNFYRYGYAMPLYQTYNLMHVAYFNSWKGKVGLNIGVLAAWIIVNNIANPFVLKWFANKMAKQAKENLQEDKEIEAKRERIQDNEAKSSISTPTNSH